MNKPGEGKRVRRESKYGEGGREVGGQARRQLLKAKVSAPSAEKNKPGVSLKTKPGRPTKLVIPNRHPVATAPRQSAPPPRNNPAPQETQDDDDIPEPGAHPAGLKAAAAANGLSVPDSPFQRLRAMNATMGASPLGAVDAGTSATEFPDQIFEKKVEIERPTREASEDVEFLSKARKKLAILKRPIRSIDGGKKDGDQGQDGMGAGPRTVGPADGSGTQGRAGRSAEGTDGVSDSSTQGSLKDAANQLSLFSPCAICGQPTAQGGKWGDEMLCALHLGEQRQGEALARGLAGEVPTHMAAAIVLNEFGHVTSTDLEETAEESDEPCPHCGGDGLQGTYRFEDVPEECPHCDGTGKLSHTYSARRKKAQDAAEGWKTTRGTTEAWRAYAGVGSGAQDTSARREGSQGPAVSGATMGGNTHTGMDTIPHQDGTPHLTTADTGTLVQPLTPQATENQAFPPPALSTREGQQTSATPHLTGSGALATDAEKRKVLPVLEDDKRTPYAEDQELAVARVMAAPGVACDFCPAAERCPEFKPQHSCAYEEDFAGLTSRDLRNTLPTMEVIADLQMKRGLRAVFLEQRVSGGQLDPNVTRQLEVAAAAAQRVAQMKAPVIRNAHSSMTVVAQNGAPAKGGGLLSRLLSGMAGGTEGEVELNTPETIVVHATKSEPRDPA